MTASRRTDYLATLTSGAYVDHRGTPFTGRLLNQLLNALRDPTTNPGWSRFGSACFEGAQFSDNAEFYAAEFSGDADFNRARFSGNANFRTARFSGNAEFKSAQFSGNADFDGARFSGDAEFDGAQFSGDATFPETQFSGYAGFSSAQFSDIARFERAQFFDDASFMRAQFSGSAWFPDVRFSGDVTAFDGAQFSDTARFDEAQFSDKARFDGAHFSGAARFDKAQFSGNANFDKAQFSHSAGFYRTRFSGNADFYAAEFSGNADFDGAQFSGDARFGGAQFRRATSFGPVVCAYSVVLAGAAFEAPVTMEIAAREVDFERARWDSTATIRLRYATVDLSHTVLSAPTALTAHPAPFNGQYGQPMNESLLSSPAGVRVTSVQGVDAAHLVLTDTDLTDCLFSGAFHLDQLRLEGRTTLAPTPTGWHHRGIWPIRWTRRRTLAEEHHWRAQTAGQPAPPAGTPVPSRQWRPGPHHPEPPLTPDPEDVAALYRQLRKAFEDGKNEPGAADFYYGECEMRRHDTTGTAKGERRLLWAYWLLSGYGLRASRATGWLLASMTVTVLLLMGFGLPTHDPDPATTGALRGSRISLTTSSPDPALHGGWPQRMTWTRAEKATRVAVNSVVFRSSGQNLTTPGTYIEMASRLLEPTLLALAALAVRGRIKR
ncbi:pentapeptide repeat-containing protein [Streptomyces sp. NPDC059466]|uniref:pentapeptide repeat-containing protein n=1 Tax=unclassified Streptomyces TaxID=2593676 RepID=UPI0036C04145